ncbi:hypothetical protein TNCV_3415421 [Trichonephila clavipes]|nr:hypothetical protein TNCV_3415421 [Trichonephila clavipes]
MSCVKRINNFLLYLQKFGNGEQLDETEIVLIEPRFYTVEEAEARCSQGSSCAMEQEAALKLWQRSEDSGFRYTTLLSDGDAKTYQYLNIKEVYGPEIKIKKRA